MNKIRAGRENKPHIGIFGRCNAGKSTLLNFITGTDSSIVSPRGGTTTDPVRKSYEITGSGPVVFIDTGGTDDRSALAAQRVARAREAMTQADLAILVYREWGEAEEDLVKQFDQVSLPYLAVRNAVNAQEGGDDNLSFDFLHGTDADRDALLDILKNALPEECLKPVSMLGDLVKSGDRVILVCPIDSEAPAGRMILPQMQALREILDRNALATVVQPGQLAKALDARPDLVITDSQVYREVRKAVPVNIEVTTFSILLAAAKGDYGLYTAGLEAVDTLRDGDRILIAENCSHQVSCDDIGRVKIPAWLQAHTGKKLTFTFIAGTAPLPPDLAPFSLMIQCGGCMVTRRQLQSRIRQAAAAAVPVTNYGMLIRKIRN